MAPTTLRSPSSTNEICPVCKSSRYLNPTLSFLINSECYHTMCTSCVDRLFTSGPAPCPVAGCHKTLRKRGFHPAFFADLGVEREVDVRKRVGAVFNRREEDFETKRDWNDYLEGVEDLVFRLMGSGEEKKEAEAALREYREANQRMIEENEKAEREEDEAGRRAQAEQEDRRQRRREEARKREIEEKEDLRRTKAALLDQLAKEEGGDPEEITRRAEAIIAQKANRMKRDHLEAEKKDQLSIRGTLKTRMPREQDVPYDSFGGLDITPTRYVLQKSYKNEWLKGVISDPQHMVGGYSLEAYYARAMVDAFAGLGVFIQEEKTQEPEMLHTQVLAGGNTEYEDGF